jgi:hypothetical protein
MSPNVRQPGQIEGEAMSRGPHIKESEALALLDKRALLEDAAEKLGAKPANLQAWAKRRCRRFQRRDGVDKVHR